MKILLDVNDKIALHFLEFIKSSPDIKAEQISNSKAKLISDLKESLSEVKAIKEKKVKAVTVRQFLNEL